MEKNKDPQVIMGRYRLGRLLGRGNFAKVYKARSVSTGEVVAIKVFDKEAVRRSGTMEQVKREVEVMRRVRHPNVVRQHEVMATRSRIYFVMEYASGGELFARLARSTRFAEPVAHRYFWQLITAVEFCHNRGVYHRDLKPENLLLDEHGNLKVSDFGLSALSDGASRLRGDGLLHTTCGTPAYVAPEVIQKRGYDGAKADIWSCGVILFMLLAGHLPFKDTNLALLYQKIARSDYKCPAWFSVDARKILAWLLDPNPKTRITVAKLMARTWFRKDPCPLDDKRLVTSETETSVFLGKEAKPQHDDNDEHEGARKRKRSKAITSSPTIRVRPTSMNAFDIISRSNVLDLAKMFDVPEHRSEARFSTKETTTTIVSKLGKIAEAGRFSFKLNKDKGRVELEGSQDGRNGALALEAEIFEVAPSVHVVEMRKTGGDSLEFRDFYKQELKPSLGDIVWAWQGGDSPPRTHAPAVPRPNT